MFLKSKNKSLLKQTSFLERNRISKTTKIIGEIQSDGDFRIDGTIHGDLIIKGKVIIAESGVVNGFVSCANIDIEGTFDGKLKVAQIANLKPTANVSGEVEMGSLNVEPGAVFKANCKMYKPATHHHSESFEAAKNNH